MCNSTSAVHRDVVAMLKRVSQRTSDPAPDDELVADLGFDSLRLLELIADLEDHFAIYIPLNDVPAIRTVQEVVLRVERLLADQGRA